MKNTIAISRKSALHYWRWRRSHSPRLQFYPSEIGTLDDCLYRATDMQRRLEQLWSTDELTELFGNDPLDVLASSINRRPQRGRFISHLQTAPLPRGSFIEIADGIFVESPALVFTRAAHSFPFARHVALGMEFCGSYALPCERGNRAHFGVVKVLSANELRSYLSSLGPTSRSSALFQAMRAAQYVHDNSASPMETVCDELLCLPFREGGYHFDAPLFNAWLDTFGTITHDQQFVKYKPDLLWQQQRIIVEYNGQKEHAGKSREDEEREQALNNLGYTVIVLRKEDVTNAHTFEVTAQKMACLSGQRLRLPKEFPSRRDALRTCLLPLERF